MAEVKKMSEGLVDMAERFADVVDAAQGRGARKARAWEVVGFSRRQGGCVLATSSTSVCASNEEADEPGAKPTAPPTCRMPICSAVVKEVTGVEQERFKQQPANPEHKTKPDSTKRVRQPWRRKTKSTA